MAVQADKFLDVSDIAAQAEIKAEPPSQPAPSKKDVPAYLALKFTFSPNRGDMGGAFCTIFETQSGKTVFQVFWLARPYTKTTIIEPAKDWRNFVKRFPQLGPLNKEWSSKLQAQLKEILTADEKLKLAGNYTRVKLRQIESILRRAFEASSQCLFGAAVDIEPVTRSDLERAKVLKPMEPAPEELDAKRKADEEQKKQEEAENEAGKDQASKKDEAFDGILIKCDAVVDPIKGKSSSELEEGDIIEVIIEGEGDGASAMVRKFIEENDVKPVFPVDEIKRLGKKTVIYVKINDEIRGIINLTKDILIKVKEDPAAIIRKEKASNFAENIFFTVFMIGALVGMIFVIRHFFL